MTSLSSLSFSSVYISVRAYAVYDGVRYEGVSTTLYQVHATYLQLYFSIHISCTGPLHSWSNVSEGNSKVGLINLQDAAEGYLLLANDEASSMYTEQLQAGT